MEKLLAILFTASLLPALALAGGKPFFVTGTAYCDTCRAGFETYATVYIAGALVKIECRDRTTSEPTYCSENQLTDSKGGYTIIVESDHEDQICEVVLVSSPLPHCNSPDPSRNRARVSLTRYNGLITDTRKANAIGFLIDIPLASCPQILAKYLKDD